jgi:antitoxin component of RelBE/YafQ-DinJ toxin-antitoxin module
MKKTEETKKMARLQVQIERELLDEALKKARESGLTVSQVVRKMLEDYIKNPQGSLIF